MKSLIEAAIAIIIVYLLLEYFKRNQAASAGGSGGGGGSAATSAPKSGCCCGGGGTGGNNKAPGQNALPSAPTTFNPITNIDFQTAPVTVAAVPPSPAPVPRQYYVVQSL